jgi:hypothetical protein
MKFDRKWSSDWRWACLRELSETVFGNEGIGVAEDRKLMFG